MNNPFSSFFWAGFECTSAKVTDNSRLDMLSATKHDVYVREDYQLIQDIGITTVREGFSWSQIDQRGAYDFSRYLSILQAGNKMRIQQVWDLNHFDYPDYLDPFSENFVTSFVSYSLACLEILRRYIHDTLYIVPMNEISFFSWISADQGKWAPYTKGSDNGFLFKRQLVQASIQAMKEIQRLDKNVRFIQVDPFMRRVAKTPAGEKAKKHVAHFNNTIRFEAWDMLYGKKYPELGGSPDLVDYIGVNYYIHNQEWVITKGDGSISHRAISWRSPERISLMDMLSVVAKRYNKPLILTETGSFGDMREKWWSRTLEEVEHAISHDFSLFGVCAYPTVDKPEEIGFLVPRSGLWDFDGTDPLLRRIPHGKSLFAISQFIQKYPTL